MLTSQLPMEQRTLWVPWTDVRRSHCPKDRSDGNERVARREQYERASVVAVHHAIYGQLCNHTLATYPWHLRSRPTIYSEVRLAAQCTPNAVAVAVADQPAFRSNELPAEEDQEWSNTAEIVAVFRRTAGKGKREGSTFHPSLCVNSCWAWFFFLLFPKWEPAGHGCFCVSVDCSGFLLLSPLHSSCRDCSWNLN
jgi:hypothetical protein